MEPFDAREREDRTDVLDWIDDGADLFRRQKPDIPPKHLVSYVVVVDGARRSMLLMEHIAAGLWLPTGGHVEPDEDPYRTAVRELGEELGAKALQVASVADLPLFVTVTQTQGAGIHTDVSLWYVVAGDEKMWLDVDPREFRGYRWMSFDEVLAMDSGMLDPQTHRFVRKLQSKLPQAP
ncbi:MAG: mismatch repair protein MutT [Patescibacteria group bacterium]|nr:mismatch repair protein MutT [Patescibacteria group bacterium]